MTYKIRKVCEEENGDGKGWHYVRTEQVDTLDENITCSTHPSSSLRDFVIEEINQ